MLLVLAPLLVLGLGAFVMFLALRDERGPKDHAPNFMSRANHPLRHVQLAINAERKKARDKAREATREKTGEAGEAGEAVDAAEAGAAATKRQPPKRARRPNWLRRVS
jgi:hypothetical protein